MASDDDNTPVRSIRPTSEAIEYSAIATEEIVQHIEQCFAVRLRPVPRSLIALVAKHNRQFARQSVNKTRSAWEEKYKAAEREIIELRNMMRTR